MKNIRYVVVAVLAAALALVGITLAASGASAETAPSTTAYPPTGGNCAVVSVGQTTAQPGESILVSGSAFSAGEHLTITLQPMDATVGHVTTSATGTFSTHITMPLNASGAQQVFVSGAAENVCPPDPIQVSSVSASTAGPNGPGGTALTGVHILLFVLAALALLGVGVLLTTAGGRRRRTSRHTL